LAIFLYPSISLTLLGGNKEMANSKKILTLGISVLTVMTLASCGSSGEDTRVADIVAEAEKMDRNELYAKAIEELDGKTMEAVGNSSRGKTAKEYFLAYLQGKKHDSSTQTYVVDEAIRQEFPGYKEDFSGKINWSQPKNNKIFSQISADVRASNHVLSMTLIQDGNQIQSKMLNTGYLLNYIPKEWAGSEEDNGHPFALQSLNKVFMFNNLGENVDYSNVWDFVEDGSAPMFMGVDSEPVGKNFLYMLTNEHYAAIMKQAYEAYKLESGSQDFDDEIDAMAETVTDLGLSSPDAKYSLAWIKRWVTQYNEQTDDGPICNSLVQTSAAGQSALIVYSKLRSVEETAEASKKNVTIAAYQSGYEGVGGFMYKHYLQVLKSSPYPWTSCAFIHFMTTTADGFSPWGKDIGGYCSNPSANVDHTNDGGEDYPAMNDRGYNWWSSQEEGKGRMVIEDPAYVSSVSYNVGDWIDLL